MFKKIRDKITEEVQQSSLRLPVSVQQLSQLSPFSNSGGDSSDNGRIPPTNLQDELLVDISEIQPAGDNKDLFSIDEDSREGTPNKSSEFHVVELTDESLTPTQGGSPLQGEERLLNNHCTINPGFCPPPLMRRQSSDTGSNISDISGGLFPIYEVPGVAFTAPPQSDLESCGSEWEEGGPSGSPLDRLSKDTVYQGFLRMRQRYHKYKGRYADLLRVFREKEREAERLREVLTKHQDKALTRMSELREQCALEQQAKAHLEQELRSDLEEKDHKIEALQTKVRLLQEGCFGGPLGNAVTPLSWEARGPQEDQGGELCERVPSPSVMPDLPAAGSKGTTQNAEDFDTVSVGSLGSISTAPHSLEADELVDKLKEDVAKHRALLGRCMENIRANKDRIATLGAERDTARTQLLEKIRTVDVLKADHERMMASLRATVESSALTMAETKQRLFEELQTKEAEVELYRSRNRLLEDDLERLQRAEEPPSQVEEDLVEERQDLVTKCSELENLVADLQTSKKHLELKLDRLENPTKDGQVNCPQLDGDKDSGFSLQEAEEEDIRFDQQRRETEVQAFLNLPQQLEIEQLTSALQTLKEKNESLKMEVARLNEENEVLHNEFQVIRAEREVREANWATEAEKWRESVAKLEANLKDKKAEFQEKEEARMKLRTDMERVVSRLEEDKAELETAKNQSEDTIALLKESERRASEARTRMMQEIQELSSMKGDAERDKADLEDARKDLERDIETLKEKCLSLTTRLQEREVQIENLEMEVQKANDKCAASTSLADQKMSMIQALKEDIKNLKTEVALTTKAREEADDLQKELQKHLEDTQTCLKREVDYKAAMEVKLGSIDASLQNVSNLSLLEGDLHNKVEALCMERITLEARIDDLKSELGKRTETIKEQTKALIKYSEDEVQMKASFQRLEEDLRQAFSQRELSSQTLEDKNKDLLALRSTLAESEAKKISLEDEVDALTRALEVERAKAQSKVEGALTLRRTLQKDLEDKSKAVEILNQSLVLFEEERTRLTEEDDDLRSQLAQTQLQKEELTAALERARLEAEATACKKEEYLKLEVERRDSSIENLKEEVARLEDKLREAMRTVTEAEAKMRLMESDAMENRAQSFSESCLATGRALALHNMVAISRKLETVRSEQDRRLEEATRECWEKEGNLTRVLARKDAEIARLTDELDAALARIQDAHEQHRAKNEEDMQVEDDLKEDMEEECRTLQENLQRLTATKASLQLEFEQLGILYAGLTAQLKEDTLEGEGRAHAFHAERRRAEECLEELEAEIAIKELRLSELDARASEYLLKVTTASNALEDEVEEDPAPENKGEEDEVRTLVQRLVLEDMAQHEEAVVTEGNGRSPTPPSADEGEGSTSSSVSLKVNAASEEIVLEDEEDVTAGHVTPPTKVQINSLCVLVEELRRVKDELTSSSKRSSTVDLESELAATREELAFLRGSMNELRLGSCTASEVGEDRLDLLLDLPLEELDHASSGRRSVSPALGVSRRVAQLEIETAEARRQLALAAQETTRKENECRILQQKVVTVESRAEELREKLDALVGCVARERDELANEAETLRTRVATLEGEASRRTQEEIEIAVKASQLRLREAHAHQLDHLKSDLQASQDNFAAKVQRLEEQFREKDLVSEKLVEDEKHLRREVEMNLEVLKREKTQMQDDLLNERSRAGKLEAEIAEFSSSIREEMKRLREEAQLAQSEKVELEHHVEDLRTDIHAMESLKEQLNDQRNKVALLESQKDELLSKKTSKEDELSEELRARDATIHELRLTLTNNQKQSRENYQMVMDDMAALELRHAREKEEVDVLLAHVKEKLLKAEDEAEKYRRMEEPQSSGVDGDSISTSRMTSLQAAPEEEVSSKNRVLENKVSSLEEELSQKAALLAELEEALRERKDDEDFRSRFEEQLAQLAKLTSFVDDLRAKLDALTEEADSLRQTVARVEGEKDDLVKALKEARGLEEHQIRSPSLEDNREKIEHESKEVNMAKSDQDDEHTLEASAKDEDLAMTRLTKESEEGLDKKLVAKGEISGPTLQSDLGAKKNSNHLTRALGELEEVVLGGSSDEASGDLCARVDCLRVRVEAVLAEQSKLMSEAQGAIRKREEAALEFEDERRRTFEMQNAMVSDLEKLVLGLEGEKKELQVALAEREAGRGSLALEGEMFEQLCQEQISSEVRLEQLRRDLRDEMDILEQQKDDLRREMKWEVERVAAEWATRLEDDRAELEARLLEEKAQFGRVLVAKNDSYERLREETQIEADGYRARLRDLQAQLDEKTHLGEELETNLEEVVAVRDSLEVQLALLKETLSSKEAKETEKAHADLRLRFESLQLDLEHLELLTKQAEGIRRTTLEDELFQKSYLIEAMTKVEDDRLKELALLKEKNLALEAQVKALSQKIEAIENSFQMSLEEERARGATLLKNAEELRGEMTDLLALVGAVSAERDSIKVELEKTLTSMESLQALTKTFPDQLQRPQDEDGVPKPPLTSSIDFMASLEDELKRERSLLSSLKDTLHALLDQHEPGRTAEEDNLQVLLEMVNEDRKVLMRRVKATEAEVARLKETNGNILQESVDSKEIRRRQNRSTTVQATHVEGFKPLPTLPVQDSDSIHKEALDSIISTQSIENPDFIEQNKPLLSTLALDSSHEEIERHFTTSPPEPDYAQKEPCVAPFVRELNSAHPNPCYAQLTAPALQIGLGESGPSVNLRNMPLAHMTSQEMESLTRAASDAYRNGSASIECLKEQVAAQKSHIEELKRTHKREVSELEALLDVKRRRNVGTRNPPPRPSTSLEEAAEFEYLKNVLYQYMMGKETQTLSKVLCAVLKFSRDQQRQITLAEEERRQNIRYKAQLERWDEAQQEPGPPIPRHRVRRCREKVSSIAHGLRLQK